jgi:hypothetical protein
MVLLPNRVEIFAIIATFATIVGNHRQPPWSDVKR